MPTTGTPGAVAADTPAAPERQIPVHLGQILQATVVARDGERAWLGYRGGVFEARTAAALALGRSYEFLVAATSPRIELVLAHATAATKPDGLPATGGGELLRWLTAFAARLPDLGPATPDRPAHGGPERQRSLRCTLAAWSSTRPSAAMLTALDRQLGHEQEARVLRLLALAPSSRSTQIGDLRGSIKALALLALDEVTGAAATSTVATATAALTAGLADIERDNAARADLGLPLWLPLLASPDAGLRDARMFFVGDQEAGTAAADGNPADLTVVLLLDLTRLGELRVDVRLRGDRVDAAFSLLVAESMPAIAGHFDELRTALTSAGLEVGELVARPVAGPRLPIADLVLPPRDGSALLDLHA